MTTAIIDLISETWWAVATALVELIVPIIAVVLIITLINRLLK